MAEARATFVAGERVRLHSLNSIVYNGMTGQVLGWDEATSRYMVRLDGSKELKVKLDNMASLDGTPYTGPSLQGMAPAGDDATAAAAAAGSVFACAVCYEEYAMTERAIMPCCGTAESTVQYCKRCIQVIIEHGVAGSVGRCPTCSGLISIKNGIICGGEHVAKCRMCRQDKMIACPRSMLCELCLLGRSFSFLYECSGCHRQQRIPHPMWRYQEEGPTHFGNVTWACHQRCGDYKTWRIVPEDAESVPPEHCPESWGRRDEWLQRIREVRQQELGAHRDGDARRCLIS